MDQQTNIKEKMEDKTHPPRPHGQLSAQGTWRSDFCKSALPQGPERPEYLRTRLKYITHARQQNPSVNTHTPPHKGIHAFKDMCKVHALH